MTWTIILNWDQEVTEIDADVELSKILDNSGFKLDDTVKEMVELMNDAKKHNSWEALKLRLEIIKHVHALHWSKASKMNINIWIFAHPQAWAKLDY